MPPREGNCPACHHPWAYHPKDGEGCQHPVMIGGLGPYDCNCQRTP
ncbi:hypothetical protein [Streptomyces mirabilis]